VSTPHDDYTRRLLARLLRPRERLSVSQWSDAHRVLSPKASSEPGPWRTARTPYLREPMDALSEASPVERVVVMKSAQLGVTELGVNWLGYIMDHIRQSKPTLVVVPTDKLLVRWVHQRLRPMIEGAAALTEKLNVSKSREGSNRLDLIDYPGGLLYLASAGSAPNLKSDSLCYVVCDEADEYGWDVDGRGDPLGLIESRQSNFPRRKLLIFSTPTVKGSSRIEGEWARSDQRRYLVPCPHCQEPQALIWEQMGWGHGGQDVWYTCAVNGCVIRERDKPAMLEAGQWVASAEVTDRLIRGYHLNALYAPLGLGYSWQQLVRQWLDAQGDDQRLQGFVNERLGLPWEDKRTAVRADHLSQRAEPYALRSVPEEALILTAGIDTQDDRLEAQLIGWGEDGRWWVIDYHICYGNPSHAAPWIALRDWLQRPLESAAGQIMRLDAAAIDMAGHYTDAVKRFVRELDNARVFAITGSRYRQGQVLGRPRKVDYTHSGRTIKGGFAYRQVGVELCKDRVYNDLRADTEAESPADRLAHFPDALPADYYEGLLSEIWNARRQRYEPKRGMTRRNEPLDTWCYAYAAAHHPLVSLDKQRPIDWRRRRTHYLKESTAGEEAERAAQEIAPEVPAPRPGRAPRRNNFVNGWRR
jgi:phage terminase large subunit GpA-like protein